MVGFRPNLIFLVLIQNFKTMRSLGKGLHVGPGKMLFGPVSPGFSGHNLPFFTEIDFPYAGADLSSLRAYRANCPLGQHDSCCMYLNHPRLQWASLWLDAGALRLSYVLHAQTLH